MFGQISQQFRPLISPYLLSINVGNLSQHVVTYDWYYFCLLRIQVRLILLLLLRVEKRRRTNAGETDLVIRNGEIVVKQKKQSPLSLTQVHTTAT